MRVLPSAAEPGLTHVLISTKERKELRKELKGAKGLAAELRRLLK